ncbi:type 4 prepilin peptidase 1 Aspartic peptidase. MEROPS family A24A [Alkalithermobacter thermoalcaliphilus JW-YL-7 = DSM 7308]|uniref:Prepilin peptidase n=1 Tax=Alkalithermobacter thermoalcaliphilus JW-YL-7 = DSM 7308 TaxID=1121328 RepID=A0A150FT59_CLOPD|nr:Prepilin peptidase [[Clostridium] paradoxum JW-YL-7 = DSM 7308]SHL37089.1 type 4 prepilin peptidase 1 Aspartic peptidase. MEROPS family A24A [[Clostridium] paradoxum JW-YL-7 = DSM 7308]
MLYLIFIFGILIGSFLNVCIYRIPKGKSIIYPSSSCTICNNKLKFFDLIPIISYIFLKGKCRYCENKISIKYPLIELTNGIIYLILFLKFGLSILTIKYFIISSILIVITFIDYEYTIIPDELIIFGFISVFIIYLLDNFSIGFINSFIGLLVGGGLFLTIALITKGAMGGGDVKLMGLLGFAIGPLNILLNAFLSFMIGAIICIVLLSLGIKNKKDYIPFGPFIAVAWFITIYFGNGIISWYVKYIQQSLL